MGGIALDGAVMDLSCSRTQIHTASFFLGYSHTCNWREMHIWGRRWGCRSDEEEDGRESGLTNSHYTELSPNNRAGCKDTVCKKEAIKIKKGEIRFGTWVEIAEHGSWAWRHW
jgi:hypothetical protein